MKRLIAMLLTFAMLMSFMSMSAFAAENEPDTGLIGSESSTASYICVAEIVETGVQYETLAAAIAAANESEGADTIKMLTDIDFDAAEALSITGAITITGEHTISRGSYAGTLFTVPAGSSLTLDGGLIIDGNNNWVMDKAAYEKDRDNMVQVLQDDCEKYFTFVDGETKATDFMITNAGGTVNLNAVTIQNNYSYNSGVVKVTAANAITNLKGATVTHVASATGNGVVVHSNYASTITVDGETLITKNHVGGNHGLFMLYSGTKLTMNNGEISHTTGWNSNGTVVGVYGTGSEFTMNGGLICSNSSVWGKDNQRNPAVYIHSSGKMTMNGGTICHNIGKEYGGGIGSYKASSVIIINAGMVVDNSALNNDYRTGAYLERGDDVDAPASNLQISGGIYTHDVSEECAPGFVCLPYDRDVSKYCDLSYAPAGYNENSRDNDYIVLPGYKISYYIVENVNGETTEKQVHEEFLLIPADKTYDQVDLFANHYDHLSDDQKQAIKTWYTTNTMDAGTEYNYSTEVIANINLYGATWEELPRITYSIQYNANGGQYTGSQAGQGDDGMFIQNDNTYNEAVTLHNGENFQREGYKLVGWTAGGVNYELGESVELNSTDIQNGTVQMYAIWELAEPDEEIEDEDVPLGSNPSDSENPPKTGDNGVFVNMIIGTIALVAMAVLVLNKKKYFID